MTDIVAFIQARLDAEDDRLEDLRVVAPDTVMWVADSRRDGVHECLGIEQHGVKRYRRWWPDAGVTDWGHVMHGSAVELFSQQAVNRGLRDIEAKRRVLARHHRDERGACVGCGFSGDLDEARTDAGEDCPELLDLAAPFADHPDYREEWRP